MSDETAKRRFRAIVPPHLDEAYRLARWLAGPQQAEDVVQDAAIRALAALASVAPAQPRAWWLAIVRNVALTAARQTGARERKLAPAQDADDVVELAPDPEATLIARDEGARVRAAIDQLPPALRETLLLREIEEMDYREIAATTQTPIGTVMSRLSRARAALARLMGNDDER